MKPCDDYISPDSDYFVYLPSRTARETFFYPICIGHFIYKPEYTLRRTSYDSFLLMYIQSGCAKIEYGNKKENASAGDFVLLDCYSPHGYSSREGWEGLWCHFDGPMARAYYQLVVSHLGNVFSLSDPYQVLNKLESVYHAFAGKTAAKEALISKQITDILTALLLYTPRKSGAQRDAGVIEEIVSYINEHFYEDLSVRALADMAMLSPYHFIRVFKRETSFTPHEYIVNTRMDTAKFMLKNTRMSIKDICFQTGFSNESVFCTAFKKKVGATPAEYRNLSI